MSSTRFAADPAVTDLPRSTDGSAVSVALVRTLDALPPQAGALLDAADVQDVFCGRAWYRTVIDHALPPGAEAVFAVCRAGDLVIAIFPLLMQSGKQLQSLTTPYTYTYRPLVPDSISPEMLRLAGEAFGRFCRSWPAVRLEALAPDWPGLELVLAGIRRSGLVIVRFDHFGNWYQTVEGLTWQQYVESRPGMRSLVVPPGFFTVMRW